MTSTRPLASGTVPSPSRRASGASHFAMKARARRAASGFASTAYTFRAPAVAAMSASTQKGPVPRSSTTASGPSSARRARMALANLGVRRGSSRMAL